MARTNLQQLEQTLNVLLKQYVKGKIKISTVKSQLNDIKKEYRKKAKNKRKNFTLIARYEKIFESLKTKKIKINNKTATKKKNAPKAKKSKK